MLVKQRALLNCFIYLMSNLLLKFLIMTGFMNEKNAYVLSSARNPLCSSKHIIHSCLFLKFSTTVRNIIQDHNLTVIMSIRVLSICAGTFQEHNLFLKLCSVNLNIILFSENTSAVWFAYLSTLAPLNY